MSHHIRIIGAGISGLTCALALRSVDHSVRVVAAEFGARTVSGVAGALWLPYLCAPEVRTNPWAKSTYFWFEELASWIPEAGVDMIDCIETVLDSGRQPWLEALPAHVSTEYVGHSPLHPTLGSWRFRVPRAEPGIFLPWIRERLESLGVEFEVRRVTSLAEEASRCDALIHCAGLEARALAEDPHLRGIRGDLCIVEPGEWSLSCAAADEATGHTYVIPRRDVLVIGGTNVETDLAGVIDGDPVVARRLRDDATRIGVRAGGFLKAIAGVRPFRTEVRLERDAVLPNVVHNYGHGGSGWTLCHGCALEASALVNAILVAS